MRTTVGAGCFQWFKDTNLKANHNLVKTHVHFHRAVFNGSKILIWKQITTTISLAEIDSGCFQWFKDTNLKANHNYAIPMGTVPDAVFNGSKILIWKQITTTICLIILWKSCFQWFKDTNLKANHNDVAADEKVDTAVFNGSKILIWKQITTRAVACGFGLKLFSMVQRY